jgi:hypothetical protein
VLKFFGSLAQYGCQVLHRTETKLERDEWTTMETEKNDREGVVRKQEVSFLTDFFTFVDSLPPPSLFFFLLIFHI